MSVQVKRRRDTAANLASFTGAQAEVLVDTTNNRLQVHDGVTAGGWPAAKLSEVVLQSEVGAASGVASLDSSGHVPIAQLPASINTRTAVSDAAYSVLATDRLVAYAALTAPRVVSLPPAASYPTGATLWIIDESGACSASRTITINRAGSDTIDGAISFVIDAAYGALALESNGSSGWTILSPAPNVIASLVGVGTAPDPNNPLSVYGASALFNGTNFNFTINKAAAGATASLIFEDGFSGRAQMGLNGSDNFSFKVSANGSAWTTAIALDATTGAATLANQRTAISDAAYSALVTDRLIAYTALTAARAVSLPAASAYPPGQALTIVDEKGLCSATLTITISRVGADTINGATSAVLSTAYAYLALESNGSNAWTIVDQSTLSMAQQAASAVAITGGTINGTAIGGATPAAGAYTTLSATGKASFAASTTSAASANLPQGTAPTSPNNGDAWTTAGGLYAYLNGMTRGVAAAIGQSHIPFVLVSSGTMGNNGALSGITAVAAAYPNAYVYMPAGAIYAGSAAGWYYAVFSSTTAATLYNNTYTSGTPAIPASPTAFSTTGPGAFAQTTGTQITAYSLSIPGNMIGANGTIRITGSTTNNSTTNSKYVYGNYGGSPFGVQNITNTQSGGFLGGFSNRGVTGVQVPLTARGMNTTQINNAAYFPAIDSTQAQSLTMTLELVTASTDTITLESVLVEHIPGVP